MDKSQNTDLKAAKELISRLTKEVTGLRNENAQLQSQLDNASREEEDAGGGASKNSDDLIDEIDGLKAELEESQEDVDRLEGKILKYKSRKKEWRDMINDLSAQLEEAESARDEQGGLVDGLEEEVEKLHEGLKNMAREKAEALAWLESQKPDDFDILKFLRGGLGELPPRPNPKIVDLGTKHIMCETGGGYVFPIKEAGTIKWADEGGRFVVSLPSVVYNGRKQVTEPFRGDIIPDLSYEVFGGDENNVYYGRYRCIKRVPMGWDILSSFGKEFVNSFFDRVVVQKDLVAPFVASLVRHMYKTGALKAECFAFQC